MRKPGVALPGPRLIIPEGVDGAVGVDRAHRVGPAGIAKPAKRRAALGLRQLRRSPSRASEKTSSVDGVGMTL